MRNVMLLMVLLGLGEGAARAEQGLRHVTFEGESVGRVSGRDVVDLCISREPRASRGAPCRVPRRFADPGWVDGRVVIEVASLCRQIGLGAPLGERWHVAVAGRPGSRSYIVDCLEQRAWEDSVAAALPDTLSESHPTLLRLSRIEGRLRTIEERLATPPGLADLLQGQSRLQQRLETLSEEIETRRRAPVVGCSRVDGVYGGREEVMVSLHGKVLRFLKIRTGGREVGIGLSDETAERLLQEVQLASPRAILPRIFRSVPQEIRSVEDFYIQDRLIDADMYASLMGGADARRVSYREAIRFIAELNVACEGRARFALPSEEQFVAAARLLYNPIENGLKPCASLALVGIDRQLSQLLGSYWQLTRSLCEPFSDRPRYRCPEGYYVRKGGSAGGANPLECMPEYRGAAPFDVAQKETSFRLVLLD